MKTLMRFIVATVVMFLVSIFSVISASAQVTYQIYLSLAPQADSAYIGVWFDNATSAIVNGTNSAGSSSLPSYYSNVTSPVWFGNNIVTSYPSWNGSASPTGSFSAEHGSQLMWSVVIKSNGGPLFGVNQVRFSVIDKFGSSNLETAVGGDRELYYMSAGFFQYGNWSVDTSSTSEFPHSQSTLSPMPLLPKVFGTLNGTVVDNGASNQQVDTLYLIGVGGYPWKNVDFVNGESSQANFNRTVSVLNNLNFTVSGEELFGAFNLFDPNDLSSFMSGSDTVVVQFSATAVPEPSTYALIVGLVGLGTALIVRRRRQHQSL